MLKLSPRLQLIFDLLLPGEPVWDFCCDHGHLGLNAIECGRFSEVHFVDQVPSIIDKLRGRWEARSKTHPSPVGAYFHALSGQKVELSPRGSVVIAGVGAYTILEILQGLQEQGRLQARRLILGPQRDEEKLRQLLKELLGESYLQCKQEIEVLEGERLRKILVFDRI